MRKMRIRGLSVFVVLVLAATTAHAQVLSTLHVFSASLLIFHWQH